MGFDAEKGFTTENIDPSWERLLSQLSSMGISEVGQRHTIRLMLMWLCFGAQSQIKDNEAFIKDFIAANGQDGAQEEEEDQPAPPPRPSSRLPPAVPSMPDIPSRPAAPPPPAPNARSSTVKRKAPPRALFSSFCYIIANRAVLHSSAW